MNFILLIQGSRGQSLLTYDLPGKRINFWWDRPRNAYIARFDSREAWLAAQLAIATARSISWKVIADIEEVKEEPEKLTPIPSNVPSEETIVNLTEIADQGTLPPVAPEPDTVPVEDAPPVELVHDDASLEARVQELKDSYKVSKLKELASSLQVPNRSRLTSQDELARAIAKHEQVK